MSLINRYFPAKHRNLYVICALIVIAVIFWSWNISNQDILGDEVGYSFRSIGYLDYLGTSFQTTPIEWYNNSSLPWWTRLSFHDHPPLFFLIQNVFFNVFGHSVFIARLPSLLAGLVSVWIFYLLVMRFSDERLARISAVLFIFSSGMVSLFRSTLIEPVLICFILLSIYIFFIFLENRRYFWLWGVSIGLLAMTKYISVFLMPIYMIYAAIFYRSIFKDVRLYLAFLIAFIFFLPVIIYNYYLYGATGHFDLQFSYIFNQATPEWTAQLGKIKDPFSDIFRNLIRFFGPSGLGATIMGCVIAIFAATRSKMDARSRRGLFFAIIYILFLTLLLVIVGAAYRFLSLYAPVFMVFFGVLIYFLFFHFKPSWLFRILAVILIVAELGYAIKTNFINAHDFGIQKLEAYFGEEFSGRVSGVIPQTSNAHLNDVINEFSEKKSNAPRHLSAVIYNANMDITTILWVFTKKFFYDGVPAMYVENFMNTLMSSGAEYFSGFTIYFVQSTSATLLNPYKLDNKGGDDFESALISKGLKPHRRIAGKNQVEMFRIYKIHPSEIRYVFGQ